MGTGCATPAGSGCCVVYSALALPHCTEASSLLHTVCANALRGKRLLGIRRRRPSRRLPMIRYAAAPNGSKHVEYDLDQDDKLESCNAAGIDLATVAVAKIPR